MPPRLVIACVAKLPRPTGPRGVSHASSFEALGRQMEGEPTERSVAQAGQRGHSDPPSMGKGEEAPQGHPGAL